MNTIIVRALAKINLAIDVLRRKEDGYHEIDMVAIPLELHDSIEITPFPPNSRLDTYLYCDDPTIICDESNLAYKALNLMKNHHRIEGAFQMMIHKRIPVEAGLGGGSADAAAVIRALDNYRKEKEVELEITEEKIALECGADVPFCIKNKPCRVRGIGERLDEIKIKNKYHVLIVRPNIGLSTKDVFEAFDFINQEEIKHPDIDALIHALEIGDEQLMKENMINVLSYPAIKALPQIKELLDEMTAKGLDLNGMSGTGSACYALSKDRHNLEVASRQFEAKGYSCFLTSFHLN